jgi:Holliday junction DNA helicase RuvA
VYEYLRGTVISARGTQVVLDIGGVGWLLNASLYTSRRLAPQTEARLFVHQVVREDMLALYGFHDTLERQLFRELIAISGVGPKVALAILSGLSPAELIQAVKFGDGARLTAIPGIGAKTAGRLVLEMGNRVKDLDAGVSPGGLLGLPASGEDAETAEALDALEALGLKKVLAEKELATARQVLKNAGDSRPSVADLVRQVLKKGS